MPNLTKEQSHYLAKAWDQNIRKGLVNRKAFVKQYRTAQQFCYEGHGFAFKEVDLDFPVTIPKSWEYQRIYRAMIGFREPVRTVKPRFAGKEDPLVPISNVARDLLAYQADELHLKEHSRQIVDESLLAAGVAWFEHDRKTGLVGHFFDSILDLVVDPDAEDMESAWWIARRRLMPRWEVAEMLGVKTSDERIPRGKNQTPAEMELVGDERVMRSGETTTTDDPDPGEMGQTNELIEIWEVFSKMGIGFRGKEMPDDQRNEEQDAAYGDVVRFYVIKDSNEIWKPTKWPVDFSQDSSWPCEMLFFAKKPRYVWPESILGPSLGLQKAVDWMASMILSKLRTTSRDFIACLKSLGTDIQEKIKTGSDLEVLLLDDTHVEGKSIRELIDFLQHPPMNTDIYRVWDMVIELFEKASGLYAALYGQPGSTQPRSAEEIKERRNRSDLRPDEMRVIVEEFHAKLARKEMIGMRLLYTQDFVASILGEEAGKAWGTLKPGMVSGGFLGPEKGYRRPAGPGEEGYDEEEYKSAGYGTGQIFRELEFKVEAASTTKPDINQQRENSFEMFDRAIQVALKMPTGPDYPVINQLMGNLQETLGVAEMDRVKFEPPPPPEPPQPDPTVEIKLEQEKVKLEIEKLKLEIEQEKLRQVKAKTDLEEVKIEAEVTKQEGEETGEPPAGEIKEIRDGKPVFAGVT
jgi:hypothetical protein